MKHGATNVEIHGDLRYEHYVDEIVVHVFVEFYSVSEECSYRFHLLGHNDRLTNFTHVNVSSPEAKEIKLSQPQDPFKVGKVSCRRYYQKHKRSDSSQHWEIGGEVYCEEITSTTYGRHSSKSFATEFKGTTQCSG